MTIWTMAGSPTKMKLTALEAVAAHLSPLKNGVQVMSSVSCFQLY